MLEAISIRKQFGGLEVLRDVSISVHQGETVSIIGRSGSGKSTLLRCLNHLELADGGVIRIDGETMRDEKGYARANQLRRICLKMGYVFQNYNLFPHLSVLSNLTLAQERVLRRSKAEARDYAMKLLETVGLSDKAASYPCQLSGGQCQRVAIARALALDPEMLCFDEPTSALDPQLTHEVLTVIKALAAEKRTLIVVTHEMKFAREVSDRVIFMDGGVVVAEGKPDEVFSHEMVRQFAGELE